MEQAPRETSDRNANSGFTFDPTNKVVGVIDAPGDANAALRDLRAAGFKADEIEVVMGEEEAKRIDVTGEGHEASVHIVPSTQKLPNYFRILLSGPGDSDSLKRRKNKEKTMTERSLAQPAMSPITHVLADLQATSRWQENVYKQLHAHPELSFQETKTAQYAIDSL